MIGSVHEAKGVWQVAAQFPRRAHCNRLLLHQEEIERILNRSERGSGRRGTCKSQAASRRGELDQVGLPRRAINCSNQTDRGIPLRGKWHNQSCCCCCCCCDQTTNVSLIRVNDSCQSGIICSVARLLAHTRFASQAKPRQDRRERDAGKCAPID